VRFGNARLFVNILFISEYYTFIR